MRRTSPRVDTGRRPRTRDRVTRRAYGAMLGGLGVSKRSSFADADPTARSLIAGVLRVGARCSGRGSPTGRTNLLLRSGLGLPAFPWATRYSSWRSLAARTLALEDWVEIRRLHRSEGMPIKGIARVMGCSRNAVSGTCGECMSYIPGPSAWHAGAEVREHLHLRPGHLRSRDVGVEPVDRLDDVAELGATQVRVHLRRVRDAPGDKPERIHRPGHVGRSVRCAQRQQLTERWRVHLHDPQASGLEPGADPGRRGWPLRAQHGRRRTRRRRRPVPCGARGTAGPPRRHSDGRRRGAPAAPGRAPSPRRGRRGPQQRA